MGTKLTETWLCACGYLVHDSQTKLALCPECFKVDTFETLHETTNVTAMKRAIVWLSNLLDHSDCAD